MFALRTGFNPYKALRYCEINRLIIAGLKMQAGVIFDRAPIAPIKGFAANKVQRARDIGVLARGHDQSNIVLQTLLRQIKKGTRQIGSAPFSGTCILIKPPKCFPVLWLQLIAGKDVNVTAKLFCADAFFAYIFTFAR